MTPDLQAQLDAAEAALRVEIAAGQRLERRQARERVLAAERITHRLGVLAALLARAATQQQEGESA